MTGKPRRVAMAMAMAATRPAKVARRALLAGMAGGPLLALPRWVGAQAGAAVNAAADTAVGASPASAPAPPPAPDADAPLIEALAIGRSAIELQFAPGFEPQLQAQARAWVLRSGAAVRGYFGSFPVAQAEILLTPVEGAGVRGGVTYAEPSLLIRIHLGRETTQAQFLDDWIMVHEMVHLAIPRVPRSQNWLHEGIATYVEGVARGRAGWVAPATVWRDWVTAMPKGQPQDGDAGLDHTPTWGRTYWGGAMFCLLADVELLKRSGGRAGLQQALQGVLAAGGHYGVAWPVDRILATADKAVGQTTLIEIYTLMKDAPAPADLARLWQELGVLGGTLNDDAPLAAVRRAILS